MQLLTVSLQPLHHSKPQPVYPARLEHCSGSWAVDEVYEAAARVVHLSVTWDRSPTLQSLVGRLLTLQSLVGRLWIGSGAGTLRSKSTLRLPAPLEALWPPESWWLSSPASSFNHWLEASFLLDRFLAAQRTGDCTEAHVIEALEVSIFLCLHIATARTVHRRPLWPRVGGAMHILYYVCSKLCYE